MMEIFDTKTLQLITLLVVPGYITNTIFYVINPKKKYKEVPYLINCIIFSLINLYISNILFSFNIRFNRYVIVFIISILLGLIVGYLNPITRIYHLLKNTRFRIKNPLQTAWDFAFENRNECYVIVTLNDNTKIKGFYGELSFASDPDVCDDLYLQEIYYDEGKNEWVLDKESNGVYIAKNNIKYIEFKRSYNGKES